MFQCSGASHIFCSALWDWTAPDGATVPNSEALSDNTQDKRSKTGKRSIRRDLLLQPPRRRDFDQVQQLTTNRWSSSITVLSGMRVSYSSVHSPSSIYYCR
ncbi:hypothetical protein AVEN_163928-1 [Araneus ventricosus]|uniref:Uncharacterized protein n=1 Tax=Araneus ventricosus TaxID=182803 RepID=A0A4Y2MEN7_ARAVE|nr:hypothetical protein AVEN_163928-1 [Araneus ventricosus]